MITISRYICILIYYIPSISNKSGFSRNFNLEVNNLLYFPAESESDLEFIAVIHAVISVLLNVVCFLI